MERETVTIHIMGKTHEVPAGLTVMRAMEHAGYRLVRGAGCRGGFCGACATVYRTADNYKLQVALACQKTVEDGMYVMQIPYYPTLKARYDLTQLAPEASSVLAIYPQVYRCVACNTCTKSCPQDIEVMEYVQAVLRGDIAEAAGLSFDCVMCGLCATRCPAEIPQFLVGVLARRLNGRYLQPRAEHVRRRLEEIEQGEFDAGIEELMRADADTLKKRYASREVEK